MFCAPDGATAALLRGLGLEAWTDDLDKFDAYRGAVAVVVPPNESAAGIMRGAVMARRLHGIAAKVVRGPSTEDFTLAARSGADTKTWPNVAGAANLPPWTPEAADADVLDAEAFEKELAASRESEIISKGPLAVELVAVSLDELLSEDIPPREYLMYPFLRRKDLCMVFGKRGHGKTWVGIAAACAVAGGAQVNVRWRGAAPARVLFVDGELPLEDVQEKFAVMVRSMRLTVEQQAALLENLKIITPDKQPDLIPDLSTPEGQAALEPHLEGVALLVLDNLSTLCGGAEENDAQAWLPMGGWLLSLRRRQMAVIFIHHAGRNNQARGHSKREDPLDHILRVQQPANLPPDSGAHFEVLFTKRRHKFEDRDAQSPFELMLDPREGWLLKPLERALSERVFELLELKMSVRDIAAELGMSKSAVQRIKTKGARS